MNIRNSRILAVVVAAVLQIATTFAQGAGQLIDVVATGYGTTVDEAKKVANRSAVEQVVGTMIEAEAIVKNNELIDDTILRYSPGMISASTIIGSPKKSADGIYVVKVKATVKKTGLQEKLRALPALNVKLDGEELSARMTFAKDNLADAEAMIRAILAKHIGCVVVERVSGKNGKSDIDLDPETGEAFANVRVHIDQAK